MTEVAPNSEKGHGQTSRDTEDLLRLVSDRLLSLSVSGCLAASRPERGREGDRGKHERYAYPMTG